MVSFHLPLSLEDLYVLAGCNFSHNIVIAVIMIQEWRLGNTISVSYTLSGKLRSNVQSGESVGGQICRGKLGY